MIVHYVFFMQQKALHVSLNEIDQALNRGYWHKANYLIADQNERNTMLSNRNFYQLKYFKLLADRYQKKEIDLSADQDLEKICYHYKEACTEIGLFLIEDGLNNEALPYLKKKAKQRDPKAQFGMLFVNEKDSYKQSTEIIEKHPAWKYAYVVSRIMPELWDNTALTLLEESDTEGFIPASEHLGRFYFYKNPFVKQDLTKAKIYFEKAAKAGYIRAIKSMGLWHLSQDSENIKAFEYLRFAAQCGDSEAQYLFAQHLETLSLRNSFSIEYWYQKAADQNHALSAERLGILLYNQKNHFQKENQGLKYLLKAAQSGLPSAQNNYAIALMQKNHPVSIEDYQQARQYFESAATMGDQEAIYNLAVLQAEYGLRLKDEINTLMTDLETHAE